jgi:hypothetical protein
LPEISCAKLRQVCVGTLPAFVLQCCSEQPVWRALSCFMFRVANLTVSVLVQLGTGELGRPTRSKQAVFTGWLRRGTCSASWPASSATADCMEARGRVICVLLCASHAALTLMSFVPVQGVGFVHKLVVYNSWLINMLSVFFSCVTR